jgi:hypothetical protein
MAWSFAFAWQIAAQVRDRMGRASPSPCPIMAMWMRGVTARCR